MSYRVCARQKARFGCRTTVMMIGMSHLWSRCPLSVRRLISWFFVLTAALPCLAGTETRVLIVGDSWAEYMWINRSLRDSFVAHGVSNIVEEGSNTAISGSTAQEWASNSYLQLITDELAAIPTIDVVLLSMGGNDFLAGQPGGGWYVGMPSAEFDLLVNQSIGYIQTVVDHILTLRPDMEILINFYDYTNFVESLSGPFSFICNPTWQDLGEPTALEINQAQIDLEDAMVAALVDNVSTFHVTHYGLMQFHFGYPSMSIPPGTLIPPGDLMLPSPPESMFGGFDCFHLNTSGYGYLADNLWLGFFAARFACVALSDQIPLWPSLDITDLVQAINDPCP